MILQRWDDKRPRLKRKPWAGIEPATFALPRQRSGQAELPRHFINKKYEHNLTISIQRYYRTYPERVSMLIPYNRLYT